MGDCLGEVVDDGSVVGLADPEVLESGGKVVESRGAVETSEQQLEASRELV